jgi:hypothetical protein
VGCGSCERTGACGDGAAELGSTGAGTSGTDSESARGPRCTARVAACAQTTGQVSVWHACGMCWVCLAVLCAVCWVLCTVCCMLCAVCPVCGCRVLLRRAVACGAMWLYPVHESTLACAWRGYGLRALRPHVCKRPTPLLLVIPSAPSAPPFQSDTPRGLRCVPGCAAESGPPTDGRGHPCGPGSHGGHRERCACQPCMRACFG